MPGMGSSGKRSKHGRKKYEKSSLVGLTTSVKILNICEWLGNGQPKVDNSSVLDGHGLQSVW